MKIKVISGIYKIVNVTNNKCYIGYSSDIFKRFGQHKYKLKNSIHENCHLQRAYNSYGEESFSFEIIEDETEIPKSQLRGKMDLGYMLYDLNFKIDEKAKKFSPVLTLNSYTDKSHPNIEQFYINIHNLFKDYKNYMFEDWEDLAKHSQNNGDIEKIILSGGGAMLLNLADYLSKRLNIRVIVGDPWNRIGYPAELKPVLSEVSAKLAVAIGLAMREIES